MDDVVARILTSYDTITVVGASAHPAKPAHGVPALMQRHGWRIIPVNLRGGQILGEQAYRKLTEVPEQVGLVDVFRPAEQTPDIARQAVAAGATALWLQLGIASEETRAIASGAGLLYVEDRCLAIERRRLGLDAPRSLAWSIRLETQLAGAAPDRARVLLERGGDRRARRRRGGRAVGGARRVRAGLADRDRGQHGRTVGAVGHRRAAA